MELGLGCGEPTDTGKTFMSYVIDKGKKFQPTDSSKGFLTECISIKAGIDPNTGIRGRKELQTSSMRWPNYNKQEEPAQKGAKVGWIIASAINCRKLVCDVEGQYVDQDVGIDRQRKQHCLEEDEGSVVLTHTCLPSALGLESEFCKKICNFILLFISHLNIHVHYSLLLEKC